MLSSNAALNWPLADISGQLIFNLIFALLFFDFMKYCECAEEINILQVSEILKYYVVDVS